MLSHLMTQLFLLATPLGLFPDPLDAQAFGGSQTGDNVNTLPAGDDPLGAYRAAALERWESDIAKLEELDQSEVDPQDAILFIGSSSIRRWESIAEDMAPYNPIRRGYGGARFSDLAVFVERLVYPHEFQALVIFVGNDITGGENDKSPEEVLRLYDYVVKRVRAKFESQPIFFVAITPTSSRFSGWHRVQSMHRIVREYSDQNPQLHFIDTAAQFLKSDGKPNDSLFVKDRLHLNAMGYDVWAEIIKQALKDAKLE